MRRGSVVKSGATCRGQGRSLESLGILPESRPYVPHLTLARFSSPDGLENLINAASNLKSHEFGSASESEFHLYESILKPSGSEYKRLATFNFVLINRWKICRVNCQGTRVNAHSLIPLIAYLLGSIPFGFLIVKAGGAVTFANPAAETPERPM